MSVEQKRLLNNVVAYNSKRRYNVNDIVSLGGFIYQNINGGNGLPSSLVDWIKIVISSSTSFNSIVQWDGNTITVPTGYAGTVFNQSTSQFCPYTLVGVVLTITANATAQDILIITSN